MEIVTDTIVADAAGEEVLIDPRTNQRFKSPWGQYYPVLTAVDPLLGPVVLTRTAHGAAMSPRMAQFYSMLRKHGIRISDFSTDECVAREFTKLAKLARTLRRAPFTVQRWSMLEDLRGIMRRLPANRSAGERQGSGGY